MTTLETRYIKAKRALFDKFFGAYLNSEQCRAVFSLNGPLLVLAGAGSGKTTVLVNRIVYLIKYGDAYFSQQLPDGLSELSVSALEKAVNSPLSEIEELLGIFENNPCPPHKVLAFTFTNKAADEIKERLNKTFGGDLSRQIWAGTFHSICLRILRRDYDLIGYREDFSIYDTDDSKRLALLCMKELGIDEKTLAVKRVLREISQAKNELRTPDEYVTTMDPRTRDIKKIFALYEKKLSEYNALDFDGIIMKTVELLQNNASVRNYYQEKFKYVLVDEYQDTNYAQFVLTELLSGKYRNIMVVGDDDQSIYRFRGATIENILNFDRNYPDACVVKLEQNYRSTENILNAANAIIKNNDDRHAKVLWSNRGEGEKITLREVNDQNEESRYIIGKITDAVRREGKRYSDFAVLYRTNELARSLETGFAKSGIPYRIIGTSRFYDHKEIKDVMAYLTLINSNSDNLRLKRIINEPKRKIGSATVDELERVAAEMGISMFDAILVSDTVESLKKSSEKLLAFARLIANLRSLDLTPSELIKRVFVDTGYEAMLKSEGFEGEGRINNVNEFISAAVEYEKRCDSDDTEPTLTGFLEEIAIVSDVDKYDEDADAVVFMTVHSAKGLEFPIVFLAGMEEGIFPSQMSISEDGGINEERRLAYVAITRAKDKLYISHTKSRMMYGRTVYNPLSLFIKEEIPPHLIFEENPPKTAARTTNYCNANYYNAQSYNTARRESYFDEFNRRPAMNQTTQKKSGAASFGIEKLCVGTRVRHALFGKGVIVAARDMGGDVLYEVKFDTGATKRLMATFAKLEKIGE
jgi:DNA helicase-2/ATP-dependent DNA helicase PcrA